MARAARPIVAMRRVTARRKRRRHARWRGGGVRRTPRRAATPARRQFVAVRGPHGLSGRCGAQASAASARSRAIAAREGSPAILTIAARCMRRLSVARTGARARRFVAGRPDESAPTPLLDAASTLHSPSSTKSGADGAARRSSSSSRPALRPVLTSAVAKPTSAAPSTSCSGLSPTARMRRGSTPARARDAIV